MRLLSLGVRNFRIHRETRVEFDPHRTVIGGPNESGKSTLVEAAHHALFLRAKTGGELQKSMLSRTNPVVPEVELSFEAGGTIYQVHKRFGAARGSTTLKSSAGRSWQGDEAESRLAELLGVEAGGRPKEAAQQWSHLWVRQGDSGGDPSADATAQKEGLLARLQNEGGAVVMQSELDARMAAAFRAEAEKCHTGQGKPKAGSELARAEQARDLAEQEAVAVRAAAERLEQAATACRTEQQTLAEIAALLPDLESQEAGIAGKLRRVRELQLTEETRDLAFRTAGAKHQELEKSDREIGRLAAAVAEAEREIEPKEKAAEHCQAGAAEARQGVSDSEYALRLAGAAARQARLEHDMARQYSERFQIEARLAQMNMRHEWVRQARAELDPLQADLAALPKLTSADLGKLREAEGGRSNAEAALDAMATGIERVDGDAEVLVDGTPLVPGKPRILSEEGEIRVVGVTLRIRPGGGNRLAEARRVMQAARTTLRAELDRLGIESLTAAATVLEKRQSLESRISSLRTRLEALEPDVLERESAELRHRLAEIRAEIERRSEALSEFEIPGGGDEAESRLAAARERQALEEAAENAARRRHEILLKEQVAADEKLEKARALLRDERVRLQDLRTRHQLMWENEGDDETRARRKGESAAARDAAESRVKEIRLLLAELQPELLQADHERIKRSILGKQARKSEAEQALAGARALLASDGTRDPHADLIVAEARAASARARFTTVERRARAVRLLDECFREEQGRLADQFTAPLAERISGYLRALFGSAARARVTLDDQGFGGLELIRGDGEAFDFTTLSGGTREQLAAAVRLAMAEILAADHHGCLPLVFDDAFAYSDPERVGSLQRMLDLAAGRGLQIIILSCTPGDYAGLGAKEIRLSPPDGPERISASNP